MRLEIIKYCLITFLYRYIYLMHVKEDISLCLLRNINFLDIFNILKNNTLLKFTTLVDICLIDFPTRETRFELVYNLMSIIFNRRLLCKFLVRQTDYVLSLSNLYENSNWSEREI